MDMAGKNELRCKSCGIKVEGGSQWVRFGCPSCGETSIIRCSRCKSFGNPYKCDNCGFMGP
jgi:hypothetical protein